MIRLHRCHSLADWDETSGVQLQTDTLFSGFGSTGSFHVDFQHHQNKIIFIASDEDLNLWSFVYDGSNWIFPNDQTSFATTTALTGRPFNVSVRQEKGLILANHKQGIADDVFNEAGSVTDGVIARFQLYPREYGSHTLNQIVVDLKDIQSIYNADLTDIQIVVDTDEDGVLDAGETTTVGVLELSTLAVARAISFSLLLSVSLNALNTWSRPMFRVWLMAMQWQQAYQKQAYVLAETV